MTSIWHNKTLTLDQQLALKTAAGHLARQFDGTFGRETIERFLHSSYDEFAERAVVLNFLPLLAEKFARQRLHALAKVEGKARDGKPIVLFLCTHNAGRSQMALGFFQHIAGDTATAWSGGSEPATTINPAAIAAMAERGIDISTEYPKPWTDEVVRAADVVVTMGCGDACPVFPGRRYEEWILDDPAGMDVEHVRPIRDEIERRVRALLARARPQPRPEQEAEMVWTIFGRPVRRDRVRTERIVVGDVALDPATGWVAVGRMAGTGTRSRGAADGAADATSRARPRRRSVGVQPASRSGVRRSAGAPSSSSPHGRPAPATAHRGGPRLGIPISLRAPGRRRRAQTRRTDRARSRHAVARRRLARWTATPANGNAD